MLKETQLALSYSVDEGLGGRHLVNSCTVYTIKILDIEGRYWTSNWLCVIVPDQPLILLSGEPTVHEQARG